MHDKFKDFLNSQFQETPWAEYKGIDRLLEAKRNFALEITLEVYKYHYALLGPNSKEYGDNFKDRLSSVESIIESLSNAAVTENSSSEPALPFFVEDLNIEILKLFLDPGYSPPDSLPHMFLHLLTMCLYYTVYPTLPGLPPRGLDMRIDLAMTQLSSIALRAIALAHKKGIDNDRLFNSKRVQSDGKAKQEQAIIGAFCQYIEKPDTRWWKLSATTVARNTRDQMKSEKAPSVTTIWRCLKKENIF